MVFHIARHALDQDVVILRLADTPGRKLMDWQIAAAIGELLGAIGVIASLIYLAAQVRNNAAQVQEAAAQTRQAAAQSVLSAFNRAMEGLSNIEQTRLFFPGLKGLSNLGDYNEVAAFSARMFTFCRSYEELYYYNKSGAVDEWVWHSIHSMMSDLLANPGAKEWWAVRAGWFTPEFNRLITPIIEGQTADLESDYGTRAGLSWPATDDASQTI